MQSKILSRRALLIAIITGSALSLVIFFYFIQQSSNLPAGQQAQSGSALFIENAVAMPSSKQASFGLPVRLKIPTINVDAPVEYVGLTFDGAMDVPKERANVAWFNLGPRPGETGSAVFDGHYGWKNRKASVFDNLYKLRKGDKLLIENDKGMIISFVVRESRRYNPNTDASDVFGSSDGKSHLNLITCEGVWNKVSKTYSKRLVVFTDKE
ncbi:MAG: class F sortase [bacterium]|nr:class F sortase [bacterium]MDZ4285379.1 class F sortase [Candidatus Sungbacteria bacterium]